MYLHSFSKLVESKRLLQAECESEILLKIYILKFCLGRRAISFTFAMEPVSRISSRNGQQKREVSLCFDQLLKQALNIINKVTKKVKINLPLNHSIYDMIYHSLNVHLSPKIELIKIFYRLSHVWSSKAPCPSWIFALPKIVFWSI